MAHQTPDHFGIARARWRLVDLQHCPALPELADYSLPGICQLLARCGLRTKRGRLCLHSPDPQYQEKVFALAQAQAVARRFPERVRLLYADEVGCYRQPTLADRYACCAHEPRAPLSLRANTRWRLGGALDSVSGAVTHVSGAVVGVQALCALLEALRARYPDQILLLAWDNWPVHRHATVLATAARLRIHVKWLPTYAPWTNPIEKLWRWMRQTCVHHHQRADHWAAFKAELGSFLDQFAEGSPALLRYVGLSPD